jgi:phosphoesterase RecJ-like protein
MRASARQDTTGEQQQALELLERSERVILTGHAHPDGDCIGAQAALYRVLQSLGKTVWILNPDLPEPRFDYLSKACPYGRYEGGPIPEHDLVVLLDCSELSRCGDLGLVLAKVPSKKLVVDHHIHEDLAWWDGAFRDLSAAATGLLVGRIAKALGVRLDAVAASGVFTSLVTDTGWFKYSNTDAETFRVASELVSAGVEPSLVFSAIYQRKTPEEPLLLGRALSSLEYFADGRLAVFELPLDDSGREQGLDSEDLLDLARAVSSVEVVILIRVLPKGGCKLSLRSKTDYDVNRLARRFGGGGHAKASGATVEGSAKEVKSRVVAAAVEGF